MRRLLRWAFNLAAAVSAVLFAGVSVAWVGSYFSPPPRPEVGCSWERRLSLTCGRVTYRYRKPIFVTPGVDLEDDCRCRFDGTHAVTAPGRRWGVPGVRVTRLRLVVFNPGTRSEFPIGWEVSARLPLLFLATAALPLTAVVARLGRGVVARRPGRSVCRRCGYDLRATPSGDGPLLGLCPECGTMPSTKGAG